MVWRKYQARRSGECWIDITGEHRVRFEVGIVETGRSRVYEGVYLKVWGPDGQEWLGEDRWSLLRALHDVAGQIESAGGKMMCTGLDPKFYETGLSSGTGYGYIEGHGEALYMMDRMTRSSEP